jgi:hypothetical protein
MKETAIYVISEQFRRVLLFFVPLLGLRNVVACFSLSFNT